MEVNNITSFPYTEDNFYIKIIGKDNDSEFDKQLKDKWTKIEEENVLRYSVKNQKQKVIEGKYGFIAQLNAERATLRRKPEEIMSMEKPFDSNSFNFMKIPHKEILFDIGDGGGNDIISVNVSPILQSHSLLLPQRYKGLPQKVTLYSFEKALEILLLSNSENMRVLFNSLCANSSVNHLHWHFYYLNHRMLLETIPLHNFTDFVYTLEDFPAKGFCIKYSSFKDQSIKNYVSHAYKIVSFLQKNQTAHNIYITRAKTDVNLSEFNDIRIYIWARSPSYGVKNTKDFVIAACEVFGHLPIRTEEGYTRINEEYVSKCLIDTTAGTFSSAKDALLKALQEENGAACDSNL